MAVRYAPLDVRLRPISDRGYQADASTLAGDQGRAVACRQDEGRRGEGRGNPEAHRISEKGLDNAPGVAPGLVRGSLSVAAPVNVRAARHREAHDGLGLPAIFCCVLTGQPGRTASCRVYDFRTKRFTIVDDPDYENN